MSTIKTITIEESEKLLNCIATGKNGDREDRKNLRNTLAALLMLDAGLRVSEVCGLSISDLWFAGKPVTAIIVRVDIAKNSTERIIPVTKRLTKAIRAVYGTVWFAAKDKNRIHAIFGVYPHSRITPRAIQYMIHNASMRAIGRKIHPHILRHTFGTRLMRCTNLPTVQKLLGHKSIQTTQVYTHPDQTDLQAAINQL